MKKILWLFVCFLLIAPLSLFSQSAEKSDAAFLPLSNLAVPESLGKIQERFIGDKGRTIIQVQDVHAHRLAQENIAAILEHLSSVCDVRKIGLEGAWVTTDLPKSRAIPTSREKQLLARSLMDEDYISGPIYAAILSPFPLQLAGVEDAALYEQNRDLFLKHLDKQKEIQEKVVAYGEKIKSAQSRAWDPALLSFGQAFDKFQETSDLGVYLSVLLKTANVQKTDSSDLDQIVLVQEIMAREMMLSKERLDIEAKHLLQQYGRTSWNFEELVRNGKVSKEQLASYPELKKIVRLFELRDKVALHSLLAQIDTLTQRVLQKLAQEPEDEALWNQGKRFYLVKKILLLKATPSDLKTFEAEKQVLESEVWDAGLSDSLELSLKFYDAVKARDEIFYQKLMNDPALSGDVVIVTGGFHTDGLSERLRNAGISYITITPELGNEQPNLKLYEERMTEQRAAQDNLRGLTSRPRSLTPEVASGKVVPKTQNLSELRNAIAWVDERFAASFQVLLQSRDARKAVAAFSGNVLPATPGAMRSPPAITAFDMEKFMTLGREGQLQTVRSWLQKLRTVHQKAMLVAEASTVKKMLTDEKVPAMIKGIVQGNDILALAQDIPIEEVPEPLLAPRGIERFEAKDIDQLLAATPKFQRLGKKWPFAIMKEGYSSDRYVVLPEAPVSLVLYRIIALNPNLYQSARNPDFLKLLQDLVTEALAREASQKAA